MLLHLQLGCGQCSRHKWMMITWILLVLYGRAGVANVITLHIVCVMVFISLPLYQTSNNLCCQQVHVLFIYKIIIRLHIFYVTLYCHIMFLLKWNQFEDKCLTLRLRARARVCVIVRLLWSKENWLMYFICSNYTCTKIA